MQPFKKYVFLVADKYSIVRQGIYQILKELIKEPEVYQSSSISEVLNIIKTRRIEILILDVALQQGKDIGYIKTIRTINPNIKILVFSGLNEEVYALRYLTIGVDGFLSKASSENEIKEALLIFLETGKYISLQVKEQILNHYMNKTPINPLERLTKREIEIARLFIQGYSNSMISSEMKLFKTTVSTYKRNIFEKLSIDSIASLVDVFNFFDGSNTDI